MNTVARRVDTNKFTTSIDGQLWIVGRLAQPEGIAVRAAVGGWDKASDEQIFETKASLVSSMFGDRDPEFVRTFVGRPYKDYIFVKQRSGGEEYILGVWDGDEVTVYYARFPECDMGSFILSGGRNVQFFDQVQDVLLCCSFRSG